MYNHLFLPGRGRSSRTAWKGHHMTSHPRRTPPRNFFFLLFFQKKKHTHSQAYKLFTLYYPAKLRKYTVAACWDFFFLTTEKKQKQKNRVHRNLERVQAKTVKNTGSNINTISAYTKWTLISNTILNTGGEIVDRKCFWTQETYMNVHFPMF